MSDEKTSILLSDISIEGDLVEKDKIIIDAKVSGDIKANEIETFPIALCDLTQIQYLDLSRNKIQMVPDCIGNLGNLQILDLDENMISYIPESICSIANNIYNCYIELDGNNLCEQYHFSCLSDIAWNYNGMSPQNQSNCCEGPNGEPNWTTCD